MSRKDYILLGGILFLGIAARIIKFNDPAMVMDTVAFSRLGKNLIEYGRYVFGENYNMGVFFPPGYPFFIGITNLLFNDLFFSAKFVSFFASGVTIILSFFLGRELYNSEAGLFAALVYALYPVILIISVDAYSDALFFCFLLLSLYLFLISLKKDSLLIHALFGLSVAVAFLSRPEGMFLLALPVLQLFGAFDNKPSFRKTRLLKLVLVVFLFLAIISPYALFLKNYIGKLTLSGKGNISIVLGELSTDRDYHGIVNAPDNLYDRAAFVLNEDRTQLRGWNRKENLSMKEYIFSDPAGFLKKYQKNVMRQISTLIKLLIPLSLPLFFSFFSRGLFKDRRRLIFLCYPFLFFLIYPMFIIIEKQTLVIVVFLMIFASGGFANAPSAVAHIADYYGLKSSAVLRWLEKGVKPLIAIVLIASSIAYLKYSSFDKAPHPFEHMRAGNYLKRTVSPEYEQINVMARKPFVNYFSDARFTMIPYAPAVEVINFAKLYSVDYIVVDERFLGKWDHYDELTNLEKYSDDVTLFYEDRSSPPIKLYKVGT